MSTAQPETFGFAADLNQLLDVSTHFYFRAFMRLFDADYLPSLTQLIVNTFYSSKVRISTLTGTAE
jgi:hypothetical protein